MFTRKKTRSYKEKVGVLSDQQLMEDEAYAKQIQAEEDSKIKHHDTKLTLPVNPTSQSFSKRKKKKKKIQPSPPVNELIIERGSKWSSVTDLGVTSLVQIMDEQAKEEERREIGSDSEQVKTLQQSGTCSASSKWLKQQMLYGVFPKKDQTGYISEKTIKTDQGPLACNAGTPKTVMSKVAEGNDEKCLIEADKKQTLQEKLGPSLHVVKEPKLIQAAKTNNASVNPKMFRLEADHLQRRRSEYFQKAQEVNRSGMRQASVIYSQQGHCLTQKIHDANMKASEQILAPRLDMLEKTFTLDLHDLHVKEALAALERILPNKEFELQRNPLRQKQNLIIVTGRGMHSRGGVSKLKPAVIDYLLRNKYKFEIHGGALHISFKHR